MIHQEARDLVKYDSLFSTRKIIFVAHILAFIIIELPIIIGRWWEKQLVVDIVHLIREQMTKDRQSKTAAELASLGMFSEELGHWPVGLGLGPGLCPALSSEE